MTVKSKLNIYLGFLLLFPPNIHAAFNLNGYAKSIDSVSDETVNGNNGYLTGNRLRLDWKWDPQGRLKDSIFVKMISDNEILYGSLKNSYVQSSNPFKRQLLDLNWTLSENEDLSWRELLFRAYVKVQAGNLDATLGRERIAWGQGRLWNPTDLFNPYNPLGIEREERPGSDSLLLKWNLSDLSFLEAAYAPRPMLRWNESLCLGRARIHWGEMDWGFVGGKNESEELIGFDHASQVFDGSLRNELSYSLDSSVRRDFLRAVLSYDYSFTNSLYLLGEFYYNGIGERSNNNYYKVLLFQNDQRFLGKDYLGGGTTYDFTALWKGEFYAIVNLDDGSAYLGPALRFNPVENMESAAGVQAFTGSDRSEFGSLKSVVYIVLQYFFDIIKKK